MRPTAWHAVFHGSGRQRREGGRFGTSQGSRFAIVQWQPLIDGGRTTTAQDVMKIVMFKDELEFYPGSPNQGGLSAA